MKGRIYSLYMLLNSGVTSKEITVLITSQPIIQEVHLFPLGWLALSPGQLWSFEFQCLFCSPTFSFLSFSQSQSKFSSQPNSNQCFSAGYREWSWSFVWSAPISPACYEFLKSNSPSSHISCKNRGWYSKLGKPE